MKIILFFVLLAISAVSMAQIEMKGDTIVYPKTTKKLSQLLPAELSFLKPTSNKENVLAVFKKATVTYVKDSLGFSIKAISPKTPTITYEFIGLTKTSLLEVTNFTCTENEFNTLLKPRIGTSTALNRGITYWFFETADKAKCCIMLRNKENGHTITIFVKPDTWVHKANK